MAKSAPRVTIYHNPRCTKSRQTLALLKDQGIEPTVVLYLDEPPDVAALRGLATKLGKDPAEMIRKKEHRELKLPAPKDAQTALAQLAKHPKILERPIVVCGRQARFGRPPEAVLEILP